MSEKVENRNRAVLDAALEIAAERGFRNMTRDQVAERAGVAVGSINNAFGTMDGLRDAVVASAVARAELGMDSAGGCLAIIAQGLADRHPAALGSLEAVRKAALATLAA